LLVAGLIANPAGPLPTGTVAVTLRAEPGSASTIPKTWVAAGLAPPLAETNNENPLFFFPYSPRRQPLSEALWGAQAFQLLLSIESRYVC
jgi:hypothetical protein